jgi:hypothetical protein
LWFGLCLVLVLVVAEVSFELSRRGAKQLARAIDADCENLSRAQDWRARNSLVFRFCERLEVTAMCSFCERSRAGVGTYVSFL